MKEICILLIIAAFAFCASYFPQHIPFVIDWINTLGVIAPIFFLVIYCFATLFFLPTMVLTLAGGALFGPVFGTFFNLIGASTGAVLAFLISRYWFSDWLAIRQNKTLNTLMSGVEKRGWQFVALLRLIPLVPFNIVNYGLGLTRIKFSHYVVTTVIFLIPFEIISTYSGYAGVDFFIHSSVVYKRFVFLGLVILGVGYLIFKWVKRRQTLTRRVDSTSPANGRGE